MKKIFAIALVLGFVVSFSACGTEEDAALGIDTPEMYGEEALTPTGCEVSALGKLTGVCLNTTRCSKIRSAVCGKGRAAAGPIIDTCATRYDSANPC